MRRLDDPVAFDTLSRITAGAVATGKLAPVLPMQVQIPLAIGIVGMKFGQIYNTRASTKELLTRFRGEHIGESNYSPTRMKENLRLRW
jgi:hypothetical protein